MSIIIEGMEMPKPGRYEAVIIVLDKSTAEIAISPAEDDIGYWKEYPIVPVPPHRRLIDADALLATNYGHFGAIDDMAREAIKNAPTVIPAEEG